MSLIRVQKNKDNPYVILNKEFLEDESISLKLKGFLAYCLSKPDNWQFHVRQLASVLKEGKDAIYTVIDEGIKYGYIDREEQKKNGKFSGVEYVIRETKIKEKITVSGNPDAEGSDAETETLVINNSTNNDKTKTLTSADATRLASLLLETIQKTKPNFRPPPPPTLKKWEEVINLMLSKDSISVDRIESVLRWLPSNDFWKTNILSANTLRKQFDALELKMDADQKNIKKPEALSGWITALKSKLENRNDITIGPQSVAFHGGQAHVEIKYTDHDWKESIIKRLIQMKINVEGL